MESGSKQSSSTNQSWYEEFGLPPRFTRIPFQEIRELLRRWPEPKVTMRAVGRGKTEIVVRLPLPSSLVPPGMRKSYSRYGVTLPRAFDDVLWQKLAAAKSTIWSETTGLMMKAYREAWLQWFRLQYLGHSHPAAEAMFKKLEQEAESISKVTRRGRQPFAEAELLSIKSQYKKLLPKCKLIHRAATLAAKSLQGNNREIARKRIRRDIWERVRRSVHGMPGDGYIFGGVAFERIGNGTKMLHEPSAWEPHQLAIALLSIERRQAYQTIEKKIKPTKTN